MSEALNSLNWQILEGEGEWLLASTPGIQWLVKELEAKEKIVLGGFEYHLHGSRKTGTRVVNRVRVQLGKKRF